MIKDRFISTTGEIVTLHIDQDINWYTIGVNDFIINAFYEINEAMNHYEVIKNETLRDKSK